MPAIEWDLAGERFFETGVDRGVFYPYDPVSKAYSPGAAWNGLTAVNHTPSGAEPTPIYADNIKYLNLMSVEEFGFTIEAFTYPDEFGVVDGSATPIPGVAVSQQNRETFGLSHRTLIGNDEKGTDLGYKIHMIWGAKVSPSEKSHTTVNDTPEAANMSWTATTTPVPFAAARNLKPTAHLAVDSTKIDKTKLEALEKMLYGDGATAATLPSPEEVLALLEA